MVGLLPGIFASTDPPADNQTDTLSAGSLIVLITEIESSFNCQTGDIELLEKLVKLHVPEGYKFLNSEQSQYGLTELWGNPPDEETLGLLFPEDISPLSENFTYAIVISYVEDGYIDDDDAADINYEELLEEMRKDIKEANKKKNSMGYTPVELFAWARPPYYDHENKKLHWAKELIFDGDEAHTLNYNLRILGRKGFLMFNVIGSMSVLPQVQNDTDKILASVNFQDGYRYADFKPGVDK